MEAHMYAEIVVINHPRVRLAFRALRIKWESEHYYAVPHNVGAGRLAFGEADGITVIEETSTQVVITKDFARALVGFVEATYCFEAQARLFLEPRQDWFRNPEPMPVIPRVSELEELQRCGLV